MLDERRVLAVKMENDLFVEMKQYLADNHITLQKFVNDLIKRELDSVKLVQETTQKNWDKEEVQKAIDDFIARNGRVPKQTEFKNENGLPSYGAAGRSLDMSPAQYAQQKVNEMFRDEYDDTVDYASGENEPLMSL